MSAEERRKSIIEATLPLFVTKGFSETTSKELASAAGVSEGLIYKYFPTKKDLYQGLQAYCFKNMEGEMQWIDELPNNLDSLIICIDFFMQSIMHRDNKTPELTYFSRLMFKSLLEDGEFARLFMDRAATVWRSKVRLCIEQAIADEKMVVRDDPVDLGSWFVHHLRVGAIILNLPDRATVDYEVSTKDFVTGALRFSLRGLGVKEEFIP